MRTPLAALAVAALVLAGACTRKEESRAPGATGAAPQPAGDVVLVGHVASMTGPEATYGTSTDRGIRLAIDEQNAKGGVKGKKIAVRTLDDQGKPEEAAIAATRLATQERVAVLLGEVASTRSLAMAPIADRYQVPMISPSSTNPKVTKDGERTRPYVFRVCFIDPFQGAVMAKFARDHLKVGRVAILRDVGNDYSMGLADYFIETFTSLGGKIAGDLSFRAGDQDFKAQLTAVKSLDPEAIYIPGYYTDVALIARRARELGLKQVLTGGDGWDSARLFEIGGKAVEGSYISNHYSPEDPSPRIQEFVRAYKERYRETPDSLAAQGYDAARVALAAVERAADLSGPALRDAIESTKDFPGVTGVITIDEHHNAVKPAVVLVVKDGGFQYVATVKP